jgi:hypothetical protein
MDFTGFSIFTLDLEEVALRIGPLISQIGPQDENIDCNVVPGRGQRRRWPESGEGKVGMGRKRKGEWSRFTYGSISGVCGSRGEAGGGAR